MKPILYDSLLVHYLAQALHDRLAGRRLRALRIHAPERRLVLELQDERWIWELHPTRGWLRRIAGTDAPGESAQESARIAAEGWDGRRIPTQRRPRVRRVHAPLDERWLQIEIDAGGPDRASRVVVELLTNQWNALALDPAGTIIAAVWSRQAGDRRLGPGEAYVPPARSRRAGADGPVSFEAFRALLDEEPDDRARGLIRTLAWTSTLNVGAIVGEVSPDQAGARAAYDRYCALAERPEADPGLLELRGGQPYPLPLPGAGRQPMPSLLAALESAGSRNAGTALAPEVRAALVEHLDRLSHRAEALEREAESAPGRATDLRRTANLLMARLHEIGRGQDQVELVDFDGETLRIDLDPSLSPAENAEALYDRARKRARAAERLPVRVREIQARRARLESLLDALDGGTAEPVEVTRWIERVRPASDGPGRLTERRPYRAYRSSGGLEIRVGRSGRANDELTFQHSSPNDIWLHARDVGGAHVILRWPDRTQNPPRRDLLEAAVLAALHSKARTAAAVPVDWTRRKYVRSPRNAPPGVVLPDRVSTVFVEPDPKLEERLRSDS